jgi:mercuric ion binding protein
MKSMAFLMAFAALLTASIGIANASEERVRLQVDNTTCASCAYITKKTISRMSGVSAVDMSFNLREATLKCDVRIENSQTDVAALASAIRGTGYEARALTVTE